MARPKQSEFSANEVRAADPNWQGPLDTGFRFELEGQVYEILGKRVKFDRLLFVCEEVPDVSPISCVAAEVE